ncbi:MAG TPA: hypothetical protein PLG67_05555 [Bacillota bacterium]|jgi:hypothetical protein|nr:hypothetical protein [Bacillota bacterium]
MINLKPIDEQKKELAKIKRIIDLQFRGFREGKFTSRRTYRSVVHAYARYTILHRGRMGIVVDIDDVQSYLRDLYAKGRTDSYINGVLSALKYYSKKTYGKDSKILHQLERIRPTTMKEEKQNEKI